jgi:hypothetical protein
VVTTTVPVTLPPTTTTEPPTTTVPPTTTTTVITDATTADPKVLAGQLQAVLDRYEQLYLASRTDPERPFTDDKLIADFLDVTDKDLAAKTLLRWQRYREDGIAVRLGPTTDPGPYITAVNAMTPTQAMGQYCLYDDAVTYAVATGNVSDDKVLIVHGSLEFNLKDGRWKVAGDDVAGTTEVPSGTENPCPQEHLP